MEYRNFFALLGGLALFLYGMHQMSEGLNAAAGEKMKQILERLTKNHFLGVGVGAAVTAVIQSSSATTVMVVGFVNSGMMTLRQAVWIIMGANIGTCITAVLAAIGTGRNAKRTTIIHLSFNLIGTVVFTVLCMTTPLVSLVAQLTPGRPAAQIANMHTIFNIGTTLLLLPAGNLLAGMAEHLLPDKKSESLAAEQRKAACKKVEDVWNS